jgi:hypothetical protein
MIHPTRMANANILQSLVLNMHAYPRDIETSSVSDTKHGGVLNEFVILSVD